MTAHDDMSSRHRLCCLWTILLLFAPIGSFATEFVFEGEFGSLGTAVGQFERTRAVAVDSQNRIVITDRQNHRIQICDDQGACTAFGSQGPEVGNFQNPQGITVDSHGHIIVSDAGNNRVQICDELGNCTTFGGQGSALGQFNDLNGIDVDSQDRIFVADRDNNRFQMCDDQGNCEAFGETGTGPGQFDRPGGITVDNFDRVIVGDTFNHRIQIFSVQASAPTVSVVAASATYPAGTSQNGDNEPGGLVVYTSTTDDPLGPFSGQSVHFRGVSVGGVEQVFLYRLDFDQIVTLDSIVVEGVAWRGSNISLLDEQGNALVTINASGDNRFESHVIDAAGISGRTFFLEELNDDSNWRYRSKIEVILAGGTPSGSITVPGTSNPWLAGMPNGTIARGGDVAPGQSPVIVPTPFTPGVAISFSATGLASNDAGGGFAPDGDITFQFHGAENGMPDGNMPLSALAGVFLDLIQPDPSSLPPSLDFAAGGNVTGGINYTNLSPQLRQVFFVGDGQTDGGVTQLVIPPAGATRLFLGIMDGSEYNNNSGAFEVDVTDATPPINETPMAVDDNVTVDTGVSVIISVLDNDQGLADIPIAVSISADPSDGTAIAGADNKVTYTSDAAFIGDDNFQYTATDRDGDASSATVTVSVTDPNANTIPIAMDDVASVDSGASVSINVLVNDQGLADVPIVVSISSDPDNGSAQILADNRILYTADNNFIGNDSIGYTVTDNDGDASSATVNVTITDPNPGGGSGNLPAAVNDSASATSGGNVIIDVLANDQGLADDPIAVRIKSDPPNGSAFVLADNRISYTADNDFVGDDSFQYTVTDGDGDRSTATVNVNVVAFDDEVTAVRSPGGGAIGPVWLLLMFSICVWSYTARRRAITFDLQ